MRIRRTLSALAATAGLAVTATVAGTSGASAAPPQSCAWQLVKAPPAPTSLWDMTAVDAVSKDDVRFTAATLGSQIWPWTLRWDGSAITPTAQVPAVPQQDMISTSASFSSADEGWMLTDGLYGWVHPAQRWHGGRWTTTPTAVSPDPNTTGVWPLAVATVSGTDAWSVGMYYRADKNVIVGTQPLGALIEHWDGTAWRIVPNPADSREDTYLSAITAASPSDVWAVGRQTDADGTVAPFAEHWDGQAWSTVPAPPGNQASTLRAVSANGGDVWAVGSQTLEGTTNLAGPLVEHWDGHAWTKVSGLPDLGNARLDAVYDAGPNDVWATIEVPSGVNDFLHWDGRSWSTVAVPGPQGAGLRYFYSGLDGTGPDDIWAAGLVVHPTLGVLPQIAHLTCGG